MSKEDRLLKIHPFKRRKTPEEGGNEKDKPIVIDTCADDKAWEFLQVSVLYNKLPRRRNIWTYPPFLLINLL